MKKVNLFLMVLMVFVVSIDVNAQLKLDSQGKTILGNYNGSVKLECRGEAVITRWGGGWENININWNNNYSAAQMYCTSSNFMIGTPSYYVGNGYFRYLSLTTAPVITSDARQKENILPITSALDKIMQVNGKQFNYIDVLGDDLKVSPLRTRMAKPTFGFIAQELEEVLPELVNTPDELNEYYSVNYTAMIPLLVEAIKEQQLQIEELRLHISGMDQETPNEKRANDNNESNNVNGEAVLYQNAPNPFSSETEIWYYIPNNARQASMLIFDMQGTLKKQMQITAKGNGSLTINASELPAGMYIYSLIVDGNEIDSKRMILTK